MDEIQIKKKMFQFVTAENCDPNGGAAALIPTTTESCKNESKEPFYENGVHLSGVSPPLIPPSSPTNLIILNTPSSPTVALQPLMVVTQGNILYTCPKLIVIEEK